MNQGNILWQSCLAGNKTKHSQFLLKFTVFILTAAFISYGAFSVSFAAPRVALVPGNSNYANAPNLANPANDAALMTQSLEAVGFEVISVIDADQAQMRRDKRKFTQRWPQRYYQMPESDMKISCFPRSNYCTGDGVAGAQCATQRFSQRLFFHAL